LTERVALVTGASGDIGRAISAMLAGQEMRVIAVSRSRTRLAKVVAQCSALIEAVAADLTVAEDRAAVEAAVAKHGRLDLLVLGSGIYERSHDPASLARQFAANVEAPYALIQAVLPLLIDAAGLVVVINSTQGLNASPGVGQYAATQHAMRAVADSLRGEVNDLGVRVTSLFLGRTATERQAAIFELEKRPYKPERLIQPDDIALLIRDLLAMAPTIEVTNIAVRPRFKP
jgi:NADP-dependent 3-hydroxy acid dehydrogenase YdfG